MTRAATGDTVIVRPSNNVYTVLAAIGCIIVGMSLVVIYLRAKESGINFF